MSAPDATQAQVRVLTIDDDASTLKVLDVLLREAGYRVFLATSAEECLRVVRKVLPDIILLDVEMPGMDGYQADSGAR